MPFPLLLGVAARVAGGAAFRNARARTRLRSEGRRSLGAVSPAMTAGFDFRKSKTGLKYGGKRIRKILRRADADTIEAARLATNKAGPWARTQVKRALAAFLGVRQKDLRFKEYRAARNGRGHKQFYKCTFWRQEYRLNKLTGTRFTPSKGRANVGKLTFRTYGSKQVFQDVLRKRNTYFTLSEEKPQLIYGAMVKRGYRSVQKVKLELPVRWIAEFDRLRKLNTRKRRAGRR